VVTTSVRRDHLERRLTITFISWRRRYWEDGEGQPFANAEGALRHAKVMADLFSESGILFGCTILVARDDEVLFEVPLSRSMN
jgi:hypothetical protein